MKNPRKCSFAHNEILNHTFFRLFDSVVFDKQRVIIPVSQECCFPFYLVELFQRMKRRIMDRKLNAIRVNHQPLDVFAVIKEFRTHYVLIRYFLRSPKTYAQMPENVTVGNAHFRP